MRFEPQPAECLLFFRDGVAQHGLAVADLRERLLHSLVRLEDDGASRVVTDDLLAALEHELQHLLHGLARGLLDELVHQRVARRFLL